MSEVSLQRRCLCQQGIPAEEHIGAGEMNIEVQGVEHLVFHFKNLFFLESTLCAGHKIADARGVDFFILACNEDGSHSH